MFRVYASNGADCSAEIDLPATDYEMLDLMEQLRLKPGQLPYAEVLEYAGECDYLEKCLPGQPDVFQLNALAKKLSELTAAQEMAAFEGLVGMEMQKGKTPVPLTRLIDFAHSVECCHVVEDATTDYKLGKFLAENGFVPEVEDLPDAAFALLDFGKIGKEHRETEKGAFTSLGYVERYAEVRHVSETMDFQPKAPAYTILLNMARVPLNGPLQEKDMVQLRLPAPEEQVQEAMDRLGAKSWYDVAVSVWDCSVPRLNHELYPSGETPLILELAQRLSELDAQGELTKYKAILAAEDTNDLSRMLEIAGTLDEYILDTKISSPEEAARDELSVILCEKDVEMLTPYINLTAFGRALLERDQSVITGYGLLEHRAPEQIQNMNLEHPSRGMEMM